VGLTGFYKKQMIPWASAGHELLKNSLLNGHIDFKRKVFNLRTIKII
jgi:hypothetical protein